MTVFSKIIDEETKELDCIECGDNPVIDGYTEIERELGYDGKWYVKGYAPEQPAPTHEEQEKRREHAYIIEVDGITAHIDRLKDEEQTPEITTKIETLKAERSRKVAAIKERFPYYDEE